MRASDHLPEQFNAASWFVGRHATEARSGRVAIVTDEGEVTYGQLDDLVRRCAAALQLQGVRAGDRVALVLPDGPLFSSVFWGAIAAGALASPINPQLKPETLKSILADCDPRVLVSDPALVDGAAIAGEQCSRWTADEAWGRMNDAEPAAGYASTHRDAHAFMLYSSGTTGEPKGVVHLQHDMWICCRTYGEQIVGVRSDDRCFSVAKLFFAYGLGNAQYFPYDAGGTSILYGGRPTPEAVFGQVARHRPTLFFGVPTAYARMLAAMEQGERADFSSVRVCLSAGEALPANVYERWRERTGLEILDGLGSTEACHCFISAQSGRVRPGASGTAVPGYELRLVDEDGGEVPRGEIGDLLVRGDSTMAFYWKKSEATARTLRDEWIRTGDKYQQDGDGYFWHAGRSDDMLKVGGIWVSPIQVEAALTEHPAVLECAVVGEGDVDGLVKPHAYVVLREGVGARQAADDLRAFARNRIEAYKCPRWVTFVPELPRTATGKLQRFLLRSAQESPLPPRGERAG